MSPVQTSNPEQPEPLALDLHGDDYKRLRKDAKSPLILIKADGSVMYAKQATAKDKLIAQYNEAAGDRLLWAWAGQWSTDVFQIAATDDAKPIFMASFG